ncbi:MAG: PAS domain-containing protein [Gammaproteobacteria bacterium]|nr:PAS domain-containing protein [Gammaproteobacteria bacterium]
MPADEKLDRECLGGVLDVITQPAILLNRHYQIVGANELYINHYGTGPNLKGRKCYEVSHHYTVPCDRAGESCPLQASLESGEPHRVLHLHHTPRGEEHVDVETRPLRNRNGEIEYLVEILKSSKLASVDVSQRSLVGRSPAFNQMLNLVQRVAPTNTTVLLQGETGTGKEVVAQAIHDASERQSAAFVPVECSGLTESLFESELFGHEKGAFTGAHSRKHGLVEAARGGTLFLDEVGDIPLAMQVKLLRLLETGTFRRVGSIDALKADFRLICATHRDLKAMVQAGGFREDLYYRISAFPIHLPALRERAEDLKLLIDTLLNRIHPDTKLSLSAQALNCLGNYAFPGNIRELRNILERASILADGTVILPEHLPPECTCATTTSAHLFDPGATIMTLEQAEQRYLQNVLAHFNGDKKALAAKLGISERTLYRKLQEMGQA